MRELLRSTTAYRAIAEDFRNDAPSQATLILFADGKNLRALLKECAKAFFGAEDGSRECALIEKERYSDCLFFPAAGGKLTADDVANMIDESLLSPVEGTKKLFVLDAFHAASPLVQNKLLKLLEEPPKGAYFLLGAEAEYPVLPTVRSRVRKIAENPFPEHKIAEALRRKYPLQETEQAAAASGGNFSVAESLLAGGGEQFRLATQFLTADDVAAFCRSIGEYPEKRAFFSALTLLLRDMLFFREGQGKYAALRDARALAEEYPSGAIVAALELVGEAEKQIQFNANFGQCIFTLALAIREEKTKWQKLSL